MTGRSALDKLISLKPFSPWFPKCSQQQSVLESISRPIAIAQMNQRNYSTLDNNLGKDMSVAHSLDKTKFGGRSDEDWITKLCRYQFMYSQNKVSCSEKNTLHYIQLLPIV